MNPNQFHMMQSGIKTVGIGITMRKTVAVGSKFFRIYKVNKIKYGEKYNKLNINDIFYIFLKKEMVENASIIRKTVLVAIGISHPTFHP